jgi:hypothetical protein
MDQSLLNEHGWRIGLLMKGCQRDNRQAGQGARNSQIATNFTHAHRRGTPAAHLRQRIHHLTTTTKTNHPLAKTQYSQKLLTNPLTNLQLSESQPIAPGIHKVKRPSPRNEVPRCHVDPAYLQSNINKSAQFPQM